FPKIASTFFAEKPLLACRNTAFHYLPGTALFACRHFPLSFFSRWGYLAGNIYLSQHSQPENRKKSTGRASERKVMA
ncbi:MAG: hypothetical protein LBB60_08410, partial [Desulfovibrio sp.]|nr:hypothetical protein [Desulfovibrio sp.]